MFKSFSKKSSKKSTKNGGKNEVEAGDELRIGLIISEQEKRFGTNMLKELQPSDEPRLKQLVNSGYTRIEAINFIFDVRHPIVDTSTPPESVGTTEQQKPAPLKSILSSTNINPEPQTSTSVAEELAVAEAIRRSLIDAGISGRTTPASASPNGILTETIHRVPSPIPYLPMSHYSTVSNTGRARDHRSFSDPPAWIPPGMGHQPQIPRGGPSYRGHHGAPSPRYRQTDVRFEDDQVSCNSDSQIWIEGPNLSPPPRAGLVRSHSGVSTRGLPPRGLSRGFSTMSSMDAMGSPPGVSPRGTFRGYY